MTQDVIGFLTFSVYLGIVGHSLQVKCHVMDFLLYPKHDIKHSSEVKSTDTSYDQHIHIV